MINKIKNRLASEQGFTLIELLVVIIIIGILVAIAVPAYLSFTKNANQAAAQANVRSAIPAAEDYYQTNGSYLSMSTTGAGGLTTLVPGVDASVSVVLNTSGDSYCLSETKAGQTYSYIGGQDAQKMATSNPLIAGKVGAQACPTLT